MTKYPEEIYKSDNHLYLTDNGREIIERAYDLGREHGKAKRDTLDGWSNLTKAIKDGENIDWEKLDGMQAKCVHEEFGYLTSALIRDEIYEANTHAGWYRGDCGFIWVSALEYAFKGEAGWTLYIKGTIPMKRKTADQLPLGMCFKGKSEVVTDTIMGIVFESTSGVKWVLLDDYDAIQITASGVEVLEEYGIGTFKVEP